MILIGVVVENWEEQEMIFVDFVAGDYVIQWQFLVQPIHFYVLH